MTAKTDNAINYTIQNPAVFLCGTKEANQDEPYIRITSNYLNNGD